MRTGIFALAILALAPRASVPADLIVPAPKSAASTDRPIAQKIEGKVTVMDGRTLWFPASQLLVRLAGIDSCELPQWAFDPNATDPRSLALVPVPCGALAKAWLKRTISGRRVVCTVDSNLTENLIGATCVVDGRDLALDMIGVGLARVVVDPRVVPERYGTAQRYAMAARYGIWATYVLDMAEWRQRAVDETLGRRPAADRNLLTTRQSEISPPFIDARRQPARRDR
ncbi:MULTISPECIES: thermonuclease family protein [unclassified Neorhizobium]|uniref:thermonuclease family protein n=1 Tax=Neorhizobium sp. SHOUNA12B TaxID=2908928 RepID=UPI001FF4CDD3|nr:MULTISPECIES: thermonuclease family protein [unclassified Neorhizobium]MCJ9672806.1 thermonuclease family protein [Neorhizobium sp. SHOUNA12B]MCJ9748429.1 thermonuclease family protein [Neorhizobium sp. SHOUNA12A]